MKNEDNKGLNYEDFIEKLELEKFNDGQRTMLHTRLRLLESFMLLPWLDDDDAHARARIAKPGIWSFKRGSLTIVDLSCPFVDESAACAMFDICLALFLDGRNEAGLIVALDEAHKVRKLPMRQARCMTLTLFSS